MKGALFSPETNLITLATNLSNKPFYLSNKPDPHYANLITLLSSADLFDKVNERVIFFSRTHFSVMFSLISMYCQTLSTSDLNKEKQTQIEYTDCCILFS